MPGDAVGVQDPALPCAPPFTSSDGSCGQGSSRAPAQTWSQPHLGRRARNRRSKWPWHHKSPFSCEHLPPRWAFPRRFAPHPWWDVSRGTSWSRLLASLRWTSTWFPWRLWSWSTSQPFQVATKHVFHVLKGGFYLQFSEPTGMCAFCCLLLEGARKYPRCRGKHSPLLCTVPALGTVGLSPRCSWASCGYGSAATLKSCTSGCRCAAVVSGPWSDAQNWWSKKAPSLALGGTSWILLRKSTKSPGSGFVMLSYLLWKSCSPWVTAFSITPCVVQPKPCSYTRFTVSNP